MAKQARNVQGLPIRRDGEIDRRAYNGDTPLHPNHLYDVVSRPNDTVNPWHVLVTDYNTGKQRFLSKHSTQANADKRAQRERLKEPNVRASAKMKHKLGVLTK